MEQSIAFSCRVLSDGNRKVNLIQHPESHSRSHFIESFDALQVLGIIEDERPGGMIPMAELKHDIVSEGAPERRQRRHFVSSASQLTGHYAASSASAYGYGNSATAFGSSTTVPITR